MQQRLFAVAANPLSDCPDTAGKPPYASGLPPLPCAPNPLNGNNTRFTDGGTVFDPITQQATKSKLTISLAPTTFRIFYTVCSTLVPPTFPACPFPVRFPTPDPSVTVGYYGVFADAYPQATIGADPQFGVFPPTVVNMLGFGALPVRATVTIKQKFNADGTAMPFKLNWFTSAGFVRPGKYVPGYEQYGPAPDGNLFFVPPAEVAGAVDIVLSDVTVDKVPLDVGSNCHTSTTLTVGALGGFYRSGGSPPVPPMQGIPAENNPHRYQQAGAYQPLFNGKSFLSGTVDIPAFSGCVAGGEDLSPLVTGMVSSQDNPVDVTQKSILKPFGCLGKPSSDPTCSGDHPPTFDPSKDPAGGP